MEEKIGNLHLLFNPYETPKEFLTWLAGWAALSLLPELGEQRQRELIANIIPLYRIRGTKMYLQRLLELHLGVVPRIEDQELPAMQLGSHSTVGEDMYLGGGHPHFFRVVLAFPDESSPNLGSQQRLALSVIELAKPAHTDYELEGIFPRMQVGVQSRVGFDTVLGT
jgi:phage tail-like protein